MQVHEDFFRFEEAASDTEKAVPERFLEAQQAGGMDVDRMRAQGYDGPANMVGIHRGVQAIITHRVPVAVYVHCKAHFNWTSL